MKQISKFIACIGVWTSPRKLPPPPKSPLKKIFFLNSPSLGKPNSLSRCTWVLCLQKDDFRFWLVAAMFVYIHTKCYGFTNRMVWKVLYTHQMFKKESSFMCLVDFECPLRDEMKLLFEQENLESESLLEDFLNLKIWILQMRVLQVKLFNFWKLAF